MNKIKVPTIVVLQSQFANSNVPYPSTLYLREEINLEVRSSFEEKSKKSKWYVDDKGLFYHHDFIQVNYRNLDTPCEVRKKQEFLEEKEFPNTLTILSVKKDLLNKLMFSTQDGEKYDVSTILEKYIF